MAQQLSTNTFGVAKWVVSPDPTQGTHTTIAGALSVATSGDTVFVRDGTYSENITGIPGVVLTSLDGTFGNSNTTLLGKITFTSNGTFTVKGFNLQTNSDFILDINGSNSSIVEFENCFFDMTNNTGISFTSSNSASVITIYNCFGDTSTSGIAIFGGTSPGFIRFIYSFFSNTGLSIANSTVTNGFLEFYYSQIEASIATNGTGGFAAKDSAFIADDVNQVPLVINGTSVADLSGCSMNGGTAAGLSLGAGSTTYVTGGNSIETTGATAIQGSGNLIYSDIEMRQTGFAITGPTRTPLTIYLGTVRSLSMEVEGSLMFDTGLIGNLTPTTGAGPHVITTAQYFIAVDTSAVAPTIQVPNVPATGQKYIIKDAAGNAATNNVTITTPGGTVTFDGSTSVTLSINHQSFNLIFDGANYLIW